MTIAGAVDRIEGDWIILISDSGQSFQVPISLFPGFNPGDVITISIDKNETLQRETEERIKK